MTLAVLEDINSKGNTLKIEGRNIDLFAATFNGDGKTNPGLLVNLAKERKFSLIPLILKAVSDKGLSEKFEVNTRDKSLRGFLAYICYLGNVEDAYKIFCEFKDEYKFITDAPDQNGKTVSDFFDNESTVSKAIKEGDFDTFKDTLDNAISAIEKGSANSIMPGTFKPDSAGLTFIANLFISSDHRFLEYFLKLHHNDLKTFEKLTMIENMNQEMNLL